MPDANLLDAVLETVDQQLDVPHQMWLLGAGVSFNAGIPLMYPLTERVGTLLTDGHVCIGDHRQKIAQRVFNSVRSRLTAGHHVEHVLSYIGDLISIADQQAQKSVLIGEDSYSLDDLHTTHRQILLAIRHTIEFGYRPAREDSEEIIGEPGCPCVSQKDHDTFVDALFLRRREGLETRPPVRFVTTNYDTLLEDAMAAAHVGCVDGFAGGATAFWDPRNIADRLKQAQRVSRHTATLCKLHGSIDWVAAPRGVVMRVRSSAVDPKDPKQTLLIYPQATKYQVTQRDPFASLFTDFRSSLTSPFSSLLAICGYSFGDEHINEEIELALRTGSEGLSILALCRQAEDDDGNLTGTEGLPPVVVNWLSDAKYGPRIHVLGSRGYYRGSTDNQLDPARTYNWWTFSGIAALLSQGTEAAL